MKNGHVKHVKEKYVLLPPPPLATHSAAVTTVLSYGHNTVTAYIACTCISA